MTEPLKISAETVDAGGRSIAVVAVDGDVDLSNAEELAGALRSAVDGSDGVVVDLSAVSFMDSSGLAVLLSARDLGLPFTAAVAPDSSVARLIEIAEVADWIPNFPAREAAIAAHASGGVDGGA